MILSDHCDVSAVTGLSRAGWGEIKGAGTSSLWVSLLASAIESKTQRKQKSTELSNGLRIMCKGKKVPKITFKLLVWQLDGLTHFHWLEPPVVHV